MSILTLMKVLLLYESIIMKNENLILCTGKLYNDEIFYLELICNQTLWLALYLKMLNTVIERNRFFDFAPKPCGWLQMKLLLCYFVTTVCSWVLICQNGRGSSLFKVVWNHCLTLSPVSVYVISSCAWDDVIQTSSANIQMLLLCWIWC